jgi:UDP-N-acetylglucosamine--N-acetylmuramyl-(pentapeptide) pyrophosphoryl-undecaprenol N-acetylglucosamine transferase
MESQERVETLWVGGEGGMETTLVERAGIAFRTIPAAGLHGVGLRNLPRNLSLMARGIGASRRILNEFRPEVLMFTGGYLAFPMALAGWRIPSLVYVPDVEPGLALKSIGRLASRVAVTTEDSRRFFRGRTKVVVSGYPVRPELLVQERTAAKAALGLDPNIPVLLVFGGSKGARSLNIALLQHLEKLLALAQVIHISGELDWPSVEQNRQEIEQELSGRYHAFPYLHDQMHLALAAADLVVSRAGASALGEFPAVGLPAVLVPYPYAWRYQKVNADFLADKGAAIVLRDEDLPDRLFSTLSSLLAERHRLEAMGAAMRSLARPQAAAMIANELHQLAEGER